MNLILASFIVFALTLILTKSKILAGKREFVELRYEAAKVNNQDPGWIHRWFHAIMTCPMCCGFWVAIPVSMFLPYKFIVTDVLVVFGANWLLHCLENLLFFSGEVAKQLDESEWFEVPEKIQKSEERRLAKKLLKILDSKLKDGIM